MSIQAGENGDDLFEVVGDAPPPTSGTGSMEPHYGDQGHRARPMEGWALPAASDGQSVTRRWPRGFDSTDEKLEAAFPRAWPKLGSKRPAGGHGDIFIDQRGISGGQAWDRWLSDLERLEFDLMQRKAGERVPTCGRCKRPGVLDEFGRHFLGCEVTS